MEPSRELPHAPGIYRFRDAAGHVLYLGRAVSLRRRVVSYWGDLGDRAHLAAMVDKITRVEAVVCDSPHEAAWLEWNLLQRRLPPWNRSPSGGQEAEVWMGGQKVRDAVSGLGRVLPLGYAADGAVGTERDMARVRGADPGARVELTGRRDAATAGLAFELAGRLQAELEALDWVSGEQKVTRSEPVDLDVYGWADGVLVSFEIRGGRLCGWGQRDCDQAGARSQLDQTPPEWACFARRSAELAARLR